MSSQMKLYADPASPVCRAVMLLLGINKVSYEYVHVSLKNGEQHKNPDLIAINPNHTLPAMEDDGFTLFESTAIMKYVCQKYGLPDHWYPQDLRKRAQVEEALSWFPMNLRCQAFLFACVMPKRTGEKTADALLKHSQVTLKKSVQVVESHFLKNRKFVGGDEVSIADLAFFSEITNYWKSGQNLSEGNSCMSQWIEDCKVLFGSTYEELYKELFEMVDKKVFFTELEHY